MKWRFYRVLALGLLLATASLSCATYWLWTNPVASVLARPTIQWAPPPLQRVAEPAGNPGPQSVDAALQRPVFSPVRRPFMAKLDPPATEPVVEQPAPEPAPEEQPVAPELPPPPQFALKGIRISPDRSSAFVTTAELPAGQWLDVGDDMAGWTLKAIENNAITMVSGEQSAVVQLYVDNSQNGLGEPLPTR
jgi:hypothetical protein